MGFTIIYFSFLFAVVQSVNEGFIINTSVV